MYTRSYLWRLVKNIKYNTTFDNNGYNKAMHTSFLLRCDAKSNKQDEPREIVVHEGFEGVKDKTKNTYLEMVNLFIMKDVHRRGHVEFIHKALKHMKHFGVHKDLEAYKSLLDVLPKGKFIPTNIFQAEFMHYPKQQQCAIDLLEQMEDNGVLPDYEMEDMLMNIFGRRGYPLRKFWRMMYWMPKFKNLSPWPVPNPPPNDALELAKLAIERISSADLNAQQTIYQTVDIPDAIDDTWIVSSQSPTQKLLLANHKKNTPIYIEGSFRIWMREQSVNYFLLKSSPQKVPEYIPADSDDVSHIEVPILSAITTVPKNETEVSVHEQEDGTIYALCATGSSSQDSLLSWIRHLEKENAILKECQIVFTLRASTKELATLSNTSKEEEIERKSIDDSKQ